MTLIPVPVQLASHTHGFFGWWTAKLRHISLLVMFNDYFVDTWLGEDAKISMDKCNVYTDTERRTNNHV